jgi:hypothetical protein
MSTRIDVARPFVIEIETTKPGAKRRTWKSVGDAKTLPALFDKFAALDKSDQGIYRLRKARQTYRTYRYTYTPGRNSRGNVERIENRKAAV